MKSKVLISLLVFTALLFGMILNVSAKLYTPEVTVTQEKPLTNKDVYDINDLSKPVTRVDSIPAVFRFTPDEPTDQVRDHYYDYPCDFKVTFSDLFVPESFGLYGAYGSEEVAFLYPEKTGKEPVYLLKALGFGEVTYGELLDKIQEFVCGAFNLSEANIGKSITVDLVIMDPINKSVIEDYPMIDDPVEYTFEDVSELVGPFTITLTSKDVNGGDEGIATLTGGGIYQNGEVAHLTAPALEGYEFLGWYSGVYDSSKRLSGLLKFDLTVDRSLNIHAYYRSGGKGQLHVAGSSYTVNDGEEQTGDSDFDIVIGTKAKVSYTGEDFLYWVNISNNIVSTEPDFTFTFVNETTLRLITSRNKEMEKSIYVIFRNAYAQILTAGRIIDEEGAEELFPKNNPGMMGLEFDKWVFEGTEDEATPRSIAELIGTEVSTVTVVPAYKEAAYKYHVIFNANYSGGTLTVFNGGALVSDPYVAYVADAAEVLGIDASAFSYWALDEDALIPASYDPEQFTVIGSADQVIKITAVFEHDVDQEPVVAITGFTASKNGEKFRLSVTMSFYLPEGYTLHKSGFVRSTEGKVFEEEDLVIGAEFTKVHETSFTANSGIYTMNLNTSDPDKKFCFRAFITFTDSEGVLHTLYSSMVRGSFNSFSD